MGKLLRQAVREGRQLLAVLRREEDDVLSALEEEKRGGGVRELRLVPCQVTARADRWQTMCRVLFRRGLASHRLGMAGRFFRLQVRLCVALGRREAMLEWLAQNWPPEQGGVG
jgi:hypothetical protein